MTAHAPHLHLVERPREGAPPTPPSGGDVALIGGLLLLNLVPVVGEAFRIGHFGPRTAGLAAAASLLAGRELWAQLRALARARSR